MSRSTGSLTYGDRAAREVADRFGGAVATEAALIALTQKHLTDGQFWFCEDTLSLWEYSSASAATASDDAKTPTTAVGMFLRASGSVRRAVSVAMADGDQTIQVTAGKRRVMPAATLAGNRAITLGTTGAVVGDEILVTRRDAGAFTLAFINGGAGAGTLITLPVSKVGFAEFQFDGTNWVLLRSSTP